MRSPHRFSLVRECIFADSSHPKSPNFVSLSTIQSTYHYPATHEKLVNQRSTHQKNHCFRTHIPDSSFFSFLFFLDSWGFLSGSENFRISIVGLKEWKKKKNEREPIVNSRTSRFCAFEGFQCCFPPRICLVIPSWRPGFTPTNHRQKKQHQNSIIYKQTKNQTHQEFHSTSQETEQNVRVKGDSGALDPAGELGTETESGEKFRKLELVLRMVMLRVTWTSSGLMIGGDRAADRDLYFRSFPRPVSGGGPATVSSQSLSRKPISWQWQKGVLGKTNRGDIGKTDGEGFRATRADRILIEKISRERMKETKL